MNNFVLLLVLFLLAPLAFAGPRVVGNGGISIVCRDSQTKDITEAYLLDLFEAEGFEGAIPRSSVDSEIQLESALNQLNPSPGVLYEVRRILREIQAHTRILKNPRVGLPLTDDALPELNLKNCQYEQLAIYNSDSGVLTVDGEILSHLSPTDVAALWVHEVLYKLDRHLYDATDSRKARRLTRMLFAETPSAKLVGEFNQVFLRYKTEPGQKILWLDETQDFAVDLIAEGVPPGTTCDIPSFSREQYSWTAVAGQIYFPNHEYRSAPWRDHVGRWMNGAKGASIVYCSVGNMKVSLSKAQFQLKIRQGSQQLMTLKIQRFERMTPFYYRSTSTFIDGSDLTEYTIRLR